MFYGFVSFIILMIQSYKLCFHFAMNWTALWIGLNKYSWLYNCKRTNGTKFYLLLIPCQEFRFLFFLHTVLFMFQFKFSLLFCCFLSQTFALMGFQVKLCSWTTKIKGNYLCSNEGVTTREQTQNSNN